MHQTNKNFKQGWYQLQNPQKFIKPVDETMESYRDGHVFFKSSLEQKFIKYCDLCEKVTRFSLEPFAIKYIKPTDKKFHRYFIDFYLEFNDVKVLVEIKPSSQTRKPIKPKKYSLKNLNSYKYELREYAINMAKWEAARKFAEYNNLKFMIITEKDLPF